MVLTTVAYYTPPWYGQSFPRGQFYLPTPAAFTLFIPYFKDVQLEREGGECVVVGGKGRRRGWREVKANQ